MNDRIEEICNKYNEAGASSIAINECRRCSKAEPNNVDLSLLLGKMYTNAGNHALATLQYQKVIRKSHNVKINLLNHYFLTYNNLKGFCFLYFSQLKIHMNILLLTLI